MLPCPDDLDDVFLEGNQRTEHSLSEKTCAGRIVGAGGQTVRGRITLTRGLHVKAIPNKAVPLTVPLAVSSVCW